MNAKKTWNIAMALMLAAAVYIVSIGQTAREILFRVGGRPGTGVVMRTVEERAAKNRNEGCTVHYRCTVEEVPVDGTLWLAPEDGPYPRVGDPVPLEITATLWPDARPAGTHQLGWVAIFVVFTVTGGAWVYRRVWT